MEEIKQVLPRVMPGEEGKTPTSSAESSQPSSTAEEHPTPAEYELCPRCQRPLGEWTRARARKALSNQGLLCNQCQRDVQAERVQHQRLEDEKAAARFFNTLEKRIGVLMVAECGVPRRNAENTLDNFIGDLPKDRPGLISGPTGTGKTHLAVGFLRQRVRENFFKQRGPLSGMPGVGIEELHELEQMLMTALAGVRFVSAQDFVWKMRRPERADQVMDEYLAIQFLVLDDFGAERPTEWAIECLGKLIYTRHADVRDTLITSNLSLADLATAFNERIASRVIEFGPPLELKGHDHRLGA